MRICLIAAEAAPLAKTGGLADVSGALTKYLHRGGHDVRLFMPFYSRIERGKLELQPLEALKDRLLELGSHRFRYSVFTAPLPGSQAPVYLIDCPALYGRPAIYTSDPDEHLRFLALTRAAFECSQRMGFSPDILHCNDWHTSFGPLYLRSTYRSDRLFASTRSVLTIHNIGYQGVFPASAVSDLGLGSGRQLLHQDDLAAGRINSLKHGIIYADAITTVSPTYSREIRTELYGMGLQETLRARGSAVLGILNGVDYDEWDPRHDRYLSQHFDENSLDIKAALKRELAARLGLSAGERTPLAGMVTRMTVQKGLELLFDVLPNTLTARDLVFVALGSGDQHYERFFTQLQQQYPGRVVYHRGYNDELAHWIEGASDMFLMPSLYEPCGLNQMYSLRYGTVPIVRRTGGLADTVELYVPATGRGDGILFDDFNGQAMSWALNTALDLYAQPQHWRRMVVNGMRKNFSWNRQGAQYVALYDELRAAAAK
jgi:starch synthase